MSLKKTKKNVKNKQSKLKTLICLVICSSCKIRLGVFDTNPKQCSLCKSTKITVNPWR